MDFDDVARGIIDGNRYMVLGTADEGGRPWVSPVYYAPCGYSELHWVSTPEAQHSRNLAARPDLSIVVFDSQAPVGEGQGRVHVGRRRAADGRSSRARHGDLLPRLGLARREGVDGRGCPAAGGVAPVPGARSRALGGWTRSAGPTSGRASVRSVRELSLTGMRGWGMGESERSLQAR